MVDSILRGVEVGIGPRRTRQTNKEQQAITVSLYLSIEKNSSVVVFALEVKDWKQEKEMGSNV